MNPEFSSAAGFADCLALIESPDIKARRRGVAQLERFHESRALRVAIALSNDKDEEIRETAREIADILRRAGVTMEAGKVVRRKIATDTLLSSAEIMDEVFFLWRRNRKNLLFSWAIADFPQLFLASAIFLDTWFNNRAMVSGDTVAWILALIALLIALFGRPFAWLLIGKAFMGSFPDRESQTVANRPLTAMEYLGLFQMNIIATGPLLCGILALFFADRDFAPLLFILYLLFFLGYHSLAFTLMPRQLMTNTDIFKSIRNLIRDGLEGWKFQRTIYISFLWCMTTIIAALMFSLTYLLSFYWFRSMDSLTIASILLIDTLIDQFWIGSQIIVAKLLPEISSQAGDSR